MNRVLAFAAVGLGLFVAQPAEAQWTFRVSPYVWANGMSGNLRVNDGPLVPVDGSVSDFDFAPMFVFSGSGPRWGFMSDLAFTPGTIRAGDSALDIDNFIWTAVVTFDVNASPTSDVRVGLGARLFTTDAMIVGPVGGGEEGSRTWVDPIASLQGTVGDRVYFNGYGDIGGFGIASDLTYQLYGAIGYQFTTVTSAELGYRVISHDYKDGTTFAYDIRQHGFLLGISFEF
ncbi:MAG: hypothetical protein OEU54_00220 [Gemmatimonadota bacterium]|nr:hypothetical protein [Gemmatimonadota bacterium]